MPAGWTRALQLPGGAPSSWQPSAQPLHAWPKHQGPCCPQLPKLCTGAGPVYSQVGCCGNASLPGSAQVPALVALYWAVNVQNAFQTLHRHQLRMPAHHAAQQRVQLVPVLPPVLPQTQCCGAEGSDGSPQTQCQVKSHCTCNEESDSSAYILSGGLRTGPLMQSCSVEPSAALPL